MRTTSIRMRSGPSVGETDFGTGSVSPGPFGFGRNSSTRTDSQNNRPYQESNGPRDITELASIPQFLFINESPPRPKTQHRHAVRSHVMHRFHTYHREKNNLVPIKHRLQQKINYNSHKIPTPTARGDVVVARTPPLWSYSPSSEHTPDTELTGNDSSPSTGTAFYSGDSVRDSSQQSRAGPVAPIFPTSRLFNLSTELFLDTSM
jgi:hypothetical protein